MTYHIRYSPGMLTGKHCGTEWFSSSGMSWTLNAMSCGMASRMEKPQMNAMRIWK